MFEEATLSAEPGSSHRLRLEGSGVTELPQPDLRVQLYECAPGLEFVTQALMCQPLLTDCPAGHYLDGEDAASRSCIQCPVAYYKPFRDNATSCTLCPEYSNQFEMGATSVRSCRCRVGFYATLTVERGV
eukprot:6513800-Pyramimonas_sp.AAC.1